MADIKTIVDHSFGYDAGPLSLIDEVCAVHGWCIVMLNVAVRGELPHGAVRAAIAHSGGDLVNRTRSCMLAAMA